MKKPSDYIKRYGWSKQYITYEDERRSRIISISIGAAISTWYMENNYPSIKKRLLLSSIADKLVNSDLRNYELTEGRTHAEVIDFITTIEKELNLE